MRSGMPIGIKQNLAAWNQDMLDVLRNHNLSANITKLQNKYPDTWDMKVREALRAEIWKEFWKDDLWLDDWIYATLKW